MDLNVNLRAVGFERMSSFFFRAVVALDEGTYSCRTQADCFVMNKESLFMQGEIAIRRLKSNRVTVDKGMRSGS